MGEYGSRKRGIFSIIGVSPFVLEMNILNGRKGDEGPHNKVECLMEAFLS